MNKFDLEFFNIKNELQKQEPDITTISKILIKLNNPTYYEKYHTINPYVKLGFPYSKVTNPVLLAITNMLKLISENQPNLIKNLQVELSWAFNSYLEYI